MSSFFVEKTLLKVGEKITADGLCIDWWDLVSSDTGSIVITQNKVINAIWVGKSTVLPGTTLCDSSYVFTVTDDWKSPIIDRDDYTNIQTYEMLFVWFFIFILFLIKISKNVY